MCAFLAIILFVSIPFNQWIRPDKALAIGGLVFGLGFCFLYYLARVKTVFLPVYWGCIGFASAFTLLSWIYTDGISGPTIIFSLIILSLANLIVTGKNRLISILLLCGPMGLLFFGQYLWPSAIVAYASGPARFIDLYTTYFMAAVTLSFVMHLTMAHLKSEQKKARQNEKRLMAILDNIPDIV
ncbi:MAG: hypothetical protein HUK40_12385 [Desulfobacter sp.]|nr:hypothetical protein [Desulfobacter sp.]